MLISIIIDPVQDIVLKRGNFPVIVEKVGSNWGECSRYNEDDSQQSRWDRDYQGSAVPLPPREKE